MKKTKNVGFIVFTVIFYIVAVGLMAFGSVNDLKVDLAVFNPENSFAKFMESFGQFTYWAIWGPAFSIIFVCRRDLNESLGVINKLVPFIKPVENIESKAYKFFNFALKVLTTIAFFALSGIGWKKLIENIIKNILLDMGKDNLSQAVYFIISFVVAIVSIILISRVDKNKLRKIEGLALAGVLLGILFKIVEECKTITNRVRFREMVGYSNGFLNEDGLSEGKYSPLTSSMKNNTDFSAFTPWYKKGDDMGIYNRADSFPSGHTTNACVIFLLSLLCNTYDRLKKLAPFALCVSVVYVFIMGYTRIVTGAHYLTDVAGAAIIAYTLFLVVRSIYFSFVNKGIIGCNND